LRGSKEEGLSTEPKPPSHTRSHLTRREGEREREVARREIYKPADSENAGRGHGHNGVTQTNNMCAHTAAFQALLRFLEGVFDNGAM
jgi:hypothetical protein